MGIGSGMVYVPSLALVSVSFKKHRALALATVTSGAAIGEISAFLATKRAVLMFSIERQAESYSQSHYNDSFHWSVSAGLHASLHS